MYNNDLQNSGDQQEKACPWQTENNTEQDFNLILQL